MVTVESFTTLWMTNVGMVASFIILKIVDLTVGVRVDGEDETTGLDFSQHGEEGYNLDADLISATPGVSAAKGMSFASAPVVASE